MGGWLAPSPSRFTSVKDQAPIVQEAGWNPGPVWTYGKNLAPTEIRSPDRAARSQSLNRLSYPNPQRLLEFYLFKRNHVPTYLLFH
jgi:hypothetical protein